MIDWQKLKHDVARGIRDGLDAVKGGAEVAAKKAGEITDDAQKKMKIHGLKKEIHDNIADLGSRIYQAEKETPGTVTDVMAKEILAKIDKAEAELAEAEKK